MWRTLYSGQLSIERIIFRSQFTLLPRIDVSIAETPNNRSYKTFIVRNLYTFYIRQCFPVSFKFSLIIMLYFSQFNGIFVLTSMVDAFPSVAKMSKAQLDRDINMDIIMEISVVYDHLFFIVRISTNCSNEVNGICLDWLSFGFQ